MLVYPWILMIFSNLYVFPTIFIHGIGGSSYDMTDLTHAFKDVGVPTHAINIKNSVFSDGFSMCDETTRQIHDLGLPRNTSINLVGVSQGGLLARCYVERCGLGTNCHPVHALVTYGTPHMGIYYKNLPVPLLNYWKDPFRYHHYLTTNKFLRYLNNEITHNDSLIYRKNMESLTSGMLMIWSPIDKVIQPTESAAFQYYDIEKAEVNKTLSIRMFLNSEQYQENLVGLRSLAEAGNLRIQSFACNHDEFKHPKCFLEYKVNGKSIFNHTMDMFLRNMH